jgi:DNA-binding IclR family transcriptional regulator
MYFCDGSRIAQPMKRKTQPKKHGGTIGLGIQSVEIGMSILSALAQESAPRSLASLSRSCAMSRTKVHRYLNSLERTGYVEREPGTGHYRLGGNSVQLGLAALAEIDFPRIGSEMLPAICLDVGEAVFLSVWGEHGATIVRWEEIGRPITVNVRVGSTMPLLRSATGQVFGAFLPDAVTAPFVRSELHAGLSAAFGVRTEADAATFLAKAREAGLGRAVGSLLPSIGAVAVPVFNDSSKLAGTLTSLGLMGIFDTSPQGHVVTTLKHWSRRLSLRLGAPSEPAELKRGRLNSLEQIPAEQPGVSV